MIGQTIVFDGHRLNDRFYVGEATVGLPDYQPVTEDRVAGNGARLRRMRVGTIGIDIALVAKPVAGESVREAISDLCAWIDVDEPKKLSLSGDGGLWRLCVPSGAPQVLDDKWQDRLSVSFLQLEPALYGTLREVTVPSGGTVNFRVGGDYPTVPTVKASAATRNYSSQQWGVRLDSGDVMCVKVPTSSASSVSMDCGARTCTVNGATTIPTLASDWFELKPGMHTLQNHQGSGACTVSWYERWHR